MAKAPGFDPGIRRFESCLPSHLKKERIMAYRRAIVKYNGGEGALLCNGCLLVLNTGCQHEDKEYYCPQCEASREMKDHEFGLMVNELRDKAKKAAEAQCLRETLGNVVKPLWNKYKASRRKLNSIEEILANPRLGPETPAIKEIKKILGG